MAVSAQAVRELLETCLALGLLEVAALLEQQLESLAGEGGSDA